MALSYFFVTIFEFCIVISSQTLCMFHVEIIVSFLAVYRIMYWFSGWGLLLKAKWLSQVVLK